MPVDLAAAAETERLRPSSARRREVLEEAVDLDEVAGAEPEVEVRRPLADPQAAGQLERRRGKAKRRAVEADPPVHDASASRRRPVGMPNRPRTIEDARARLDLEGRAAVGALEPAFRPAQGERERRAAREPGARQVDVAEEPLEREPLRTSRASVIGFSRRRPARFSMRNDPRPRPPRSGPGRSRATSASGRAETVASRSSKRKPFASTFGALSLPGDAEAAPRRDAELARMRRVPREPELRAEDPLDLGDVELARDEQQDRRDSRRRLSTRSRGAQVAELADGAQSCRSTRRAPDRGGRRGRGRRGEARRWAASAVPGGRPACRV